jgi:hypothetical protein
MKKIIIAVLFVLMVPQLRGQYLVSGLIGVISTANEGGYEGSITWYNNSPATLHGLKAAWNLGERFKLGYTLHYGSNVVSSLTMNQRYRLYMIETGFYLEYLHKEIIKDWVLSFPVNFNVGSFYVPSTYVPVDQPNATGYFALEPRAQLNHPLFKWLLFTCSAGYRFVSAGKLYGSNNPSLAGPSLNFGLVLGNFK